MEKVVIIGSGPAGLSAAIYAARANLAPVVIASTSKPGGALTDTTDVDNYPGFHEGIKGPVLMENMQAQAERFGAKIVLEDVTNIIATDAVKRISLGNGETLDTQTLIFATGSAYRKLGLPNEDELSGYGVSWCATCDAPFFSGDEVAVVGGGDTALEEALHLTKFATKVTVIVRGAELRASKAMQDRAFASDKIVFLWSTQVSEIQGDGELTGLKLLSTSGAETELSVTGLFVAIGSDPRTHLLHGQVDFTDDGVIAVEGRSSKTSAPGVFAAGDVIDTAYKQAGVAASSGIVAALDAEAYIEYPELAE